MPIPSGAMGSPYCGGEAGNLAEMATQALDKLYDKHNDSQLKPPVAPPNNSPTPVVEKKITLTSSEVMFDTKTKLDLLQILITNNIKSVSFNDSSITFEHNNKKYIITPCQ